MSTRANIASAVASIGVLFIGWQVGAHGGAAVAAPAGGATAPTTPVSATTDTAPSSTTTTTETPIPSTTTTAPSTTTTVPSTTNPAPTTAPTAPGGVPGGHDGTGGTTVTLTVPPGASGTFTGQAASHRWGSVEVTVTLASGKITGLSESVSDDGDRHSTRINSQAVPVLKQAILAASGGEKISTVSGATYTTQAYLTSLQSALDQAR